MEEISRLEEKEGSEEREDLKERKDWKGRAGRKSKKDWERKTNGPARRDRRSRAFINLSFGLQAVWGQRFWLLFCYWQG